ncbi:threonylcarbamoyl-AMP synthase [Catenovulum sp. SM1970]|uniref:L-threonylcarbamoyladenylate synthase n=1 Tax=Marinifaba aquimaris TaxID=2741323 RepID=UPI0015746E9D|nr:L-threonylcarbamoyladenylate synthase [Marinifaba aquimaris]NTS78639.1 threonylcarbamoyl-AMP synthase [Marinifaba aquimaris]
MSQVEHAKTAAEAFLQGGVIAYPTEAVFGLGCDPDNQAAVEKILAIKNRPVEKGLILLAGDYSQLLPYIDEAAIPEQKREEMLARWPDGITHVVPANRDTAKFLTGQFDTIAVRITSQQDVVDLCQATGKPVVSTSCNYSGEEPARTWQQAEQDVGDAVDFIIKGKTLGYTQPSQIIDALTGEVFRA